MRAPLSNWTGFYIGGHLGGAFSGSNDFNGAVLSESSARLLGGVQAGLDWQFAPNWVLGTEGQYSWLGKSNLTATFPGGYVYTNDQRGLGSITARIGYTWGPGLVYVKGGYAYSDNSERVTLGGAPIRLPAQWQPQQRLHRRRRRRIHVRPELVGQRRVHVLRLRQHPLRDPCRAGAVRKLPHRRPHAEARRQLSLQLRKPGGGTLLSAFNCELRKAGFHAGLLFFGPVFRFTEKIRQMQAIRCQKCGEKPSGSKLVNRVQGYCRARKHLKVA